jgi:hypothetical protein
MLAASPEYFSVCTHNSLSVTVECDMSTAANGKLFRQTVQHRLPSDVDAIECEGVKSGWRVLWPHSSCSFAVCSQEMGRPTAVHVGRTS